MTNEARPTARNVAMILLAGALVMGCGVDRSTGPQPVVGWNIPTMPMPLLGEATVAGLILDAAGNPVAGATVKVAETDASVVTDASGSYQLTVPSDSTLTLVTSAMGFASTYREAIIVADRAAVTGFDVLMLATDKVASMNAGAGTDVATRGVVALRLHSLSTGCTMAGAHIAVWPPNAGTITYSRPADAGALDEPDVAMDSVQPGVRVDAWLLGALPPGNNIAIAVEQAGCELLTASPSMGGFLYPGMRHIELQALTVADLFLQ